MPLSSTAQSGFAASSAYDTNRPSYPPEAVSRFLKVVDIKDASRARIVDLAAGTGKFTEILASQPENFDIVAVEPHAEMREQLSAKNLASVTVADGSAEDISGIEDGSVAALVTAQAFHWFANMDALKEIHRVLQPTGVFGMIWNVEDYNAPREWTIHEGWETTMREKMWELDDGLPRFRNEKWKDVFDEQAQGNPISLHMADPMFGLPIGEDSMDVEVWMEKEKLLERFRTYSQVANLNVDGLKSFEKTFWEAVDDVQTKVDDQGRIAVHGKVVWAWASKIPDVPLQNFGNPDD